MAQSAIGIPDALHSAHQSDVTPENPENWRSLLTKSQANFTDLYNGAGSVATNVTAHPGGGQIVTAGDPSIITAQATRVGTVATALDSVTMQSAALSEGQERAIYNDGANVLAIYPFTGDKINDLAANQYIELPPNSVIYLKCFQAATGWTAFGIGSQQKYNTNASAVGFTLAAADITGGTVETFLNLTGALGAGAAAQLPTVASLLAAIPNLGPGSTYKLRIYNSSAGAFAWTITTNTGWTLSGTMTIAQNTYRDFLVSFQSAAAATIQSLGQTAFTAL